MIAGLRDEFPGLFHALTTIPGPRVSRTSLVWAVLAAVGAQLIVSAIVQLAVAAIYPVLFPPTTPPPFRFSIRLLWECAGAVAAGAVALRAGGLSATLGFVVLQMLFLPADLSVRAFSCSRTVPGQGPESCDYVAAALVADRWPYWLALALGIALARFLAVRSGGSNQLLQAAGVLSVCTAIGSGLNVLWIVYRPTTSSPTDLFTYLSLGFPYWIGLLTGGLFAGVLLTRSRFAALLVLAIVLIGPSFAVGVPLLRGQAGMPSLPPTSPFFWSMWQWLWLPLAAVAVMVVAREIARMRNRVLSSL